MDKVLLTILCIEMGLVVWVLLKRLPNKNQREKHVESKVIHMDREDLPEKQFYQLDRRTSIVSRRPNHQDVQPLGGH